MTRTRANISGGMIGVAGEATTSGWELVCGKIEVKNGVSLVAGTSFGERDDDEAKGVDVLMSTWPSVGGDAKSDSGDGDETALLVVAVALLQSKRALVDGDAATAAAVKGSDCANEMPAPPSARSMHAHTCATEVHACISTTNTGK